MLDNLPKTKLEAQKNNSKAFFTGKPCKNGHIDKRYTRDSRCYSCQRDYNKKFDKNNPDKAHKTRSKTYFKYKEKRLLERKIWGENNKEKEKINKNRWAKNNQDKIKISQQNYYNKKKQDPYWRLIHNCRFAIWKWLKQDKNYKKWESLVNFTAKELISHLESQFNENMDWEIMEVIGK